MGLIWQELSAILSDAWDKIDLWAGLLRAAIAANYQLIIVAAIGIPLSLFLMGFPTLAALDALFNPIRDWQRTFGTDSGVPAYRGMSGFAGFVMFFLGLGTLTLTGELSERIFKRLGGKPKDDSTESE